MKENSCGIGDMKNWRMNSQLFDLVDKCQKLLDLLVCQRGIIIVRIGKMG
jgi:hypothetical protein